MPIFMRTGLQKPGSKPSKRRRGRRCGGGGSPEKPSPNSTPIRNPNWRARASIISRKSVWERTVWGSCESASWNWLSKARIAARRVSIEGRDVHDERRARGRIRSRSRSSAGAGARGARSRSCAGPRSTPRRSTSCPARAWSGWRSSGYGVKTSRGFSRRMTSMTASSSSRDLRRPPSPRSSVSRKSAPRISAARSASRRADRGGPARAHLAPRQVHDPEAFAGRLEPDERSRRRSARRRPDARRSRERQPAWIFFGSASAGPSTSTTTTLPPLPAAARTVSRKPRPQASRDTRGG